MTLDSGSLLAGTLLGILIGSWAVYFLFGLFKKPVHCVWIGNFKKFSELFEVLKTSLVYVSPGAVNLLSRVTSYQHRAYVKYQIFKPADYGVRGFLSFDAIVLLAKSHKLNLCPPEMAAYMLFTLPPVQEEDQLILAMNSVTDPVHGNQLLVLETSGREYFLDVLPIREDSKFSPYAKFVFVKSVQ